MVKKPDFCVKPGVLHKFCPADAASISKCLDDKKPSRVGRNLGEKNRDFFVM